MVQTLYFPQLPQLVVVEVAQEVALLLAGQHKAVAQVVVVVHQIPLD
jgi:hypothetical protein